MPSTQIQSALKSETNEAGRAYLLRMAPALAEANQRLFKMQSEAATAAFAENSEHLKRLLNTKDPAAALTEWSNLYQANMRRVHDLTHSCFEIVPEIQAELAKLMGEGLAFSSNAAQHDLDKVTQAVTDEREATAIAVKDSSAKGVKRANGPQVKRNQVAR